MVLERIDIEGVFKDEISNRIEAAIQSIAEFGGEVEHGISAMDRINAVSKTTGRSLTLVANAARMLADEGEDAASVSRHLGTAMELASQKMLKTEDAGRILGRTLRGDVAALKELSPAASRAADKIAKITDPAIRAQLGMQLLNRELKGSPRAFDRMSDAMARADVKLESMGLGFVSTKALAMGAAGAVAVLGAAIGKLAKSSLEAYIQQSSNAKQQMVELTTATTKLEVAIGSLIFNVGDLDEAFGSWTVRIDKATAIISSFEGWLEKNNIQWQNSVMNIGHATQENDTWVASVGNMILNTINLIGWMNPFAGIFKGTTKVLGHAIDAFDEWTDGMIGAEAQSIATASAVNTAVIPALVDVGGFVDSLAAKYRSPSQPDQQWTHRSRAVSAS